MTNLSSNNNTYTITVTNSQARYYSELSHEYAQQAGSYATAAGTSATLASEWATKTNGMVQGIEYSAKYYAQQAELSYEDVISIIASSTSTIEAEATAALTTISGAKTDALTTIGGAKTAALTTIGGAKTEAINTITTAKTQATTAITNAKNNALGSITTATTSATSSVGTAKTNAISSIGTATTNALGSITTATTSATGSIETAKTDALTTIEATGTSIINTASGYASNAHIWAEGTDADVSELGGTHSAKEWCQYNSSVNQNDVRALQATLNSGAVYTKDDSDSINSRLDELKGLAHSTYDSTKFTKVGSPTITDEGVVTYFPAQSGLYTESFTPFSASSNWVVEGSIKGSDGTKSYPIFTIRNNSVNAEVINVTMVGSTNASHPSALLIYYPTDASTRPFVYTSNNMWQANTQYYYKVLYDGKLKVYFGTDRNNLTLVQTISTIFTNYNFNRIMFNGMDINSWQPERVGISLDLKNFSVTSGGVPVFSSNQTGIDTYTIGGSTVTIPYTLSKTGSKIVNSYYRTQVTSLYNQQGYAPYYTLSDTDFTLPMGELYGMTAYRDLSNLSQTTRSEVAAWSLPDYSTSLDIIIPEITSGNPFEYDVTSDCYVFFDIRSSNSYVTISIKKGTTTNAIFCPVSGGFGFVNLYLSAGDKISLSDTGIGDGSNLHLFGLRG